MYGIFTYIWLIFMVNVGIYTIHGSYGIWLLRCSAFLFTTGCQQCQIRQAPTCRKVMEEMTYTFKRMTRAVRPRALASGFAQSSFFQKSAVLAVCLIGVLRCQTQESPQFSGRKAGVFQVENTGRFPNFWATPPSGYVAVDGTSLTVCEAAEWKITFCFSISCQQL